MHAIAPVRIVLVEPRESGNVGAAARAMKNFGFTDLVVVGEPRPLDEASVWWASGAEDLVDGAARVTTLADALEGIHVAVATTSGRGRAEQPPRLPREIGTMRSHLPVSQRMAIVFGRERGGLRSDELDLCTEQATIPTSAQFPVMNLAQAVSLFCYELSMIDGRATEIPGEDSVPKATHEQLERVHQSAQQILLEIGFLNPQNPDVTYRELRSLLNRSEPSERDVIILLGVVRQLRWALGQTFTASQEGSLAERIDADSSGRE